MTSSRDDDGWNDLYAELGLDKPARSPEPVREPEPIEPEPRGEVAFESEPADHWADEVPPNAGDLATDDMIVEPEEGDEEGGDEAGAEGEGPPGTGRKRRRRRRRRKKSGPGEGDAAGESAPVAAPRREREPALAGSRHHANDDLDAMEPENDTHAAVGGDEDSVGETLRDLVAHWNVPSWDAIIGGLYRPER